MRVCVQDWFSTQQSVHNLLRVYNILWTPVWVRNLPFDTQASLTCCADMYYFSAPPDQMHWRNGMLQEGATRCLPCNVTIPGESTTNSLMSNACTSANHLQTWSPRVCWESTVSAAYGVCAAMCWYVTDEHEYCSVTHLTLT